MSRVNGSCRGLCSSKNTPAAAFLTSFAPLANEPTARRAANGDRNPLLRTGSETTGRVSEANRGARIARSAPQSRSPKPTEGWVWAAIHVAGFGLAIGGLRPSNTSMGFSTVREATAFAVASVSFSSLNTRLPFPSTWSPPPAYPPRNASRPPP